MTRSWTKPLAVFATLTIISTLGATILGFLGDIYWPCDLFSHFRVQYAGALLLATPLALILKRWKLASMAILGMSINIAVIAPLYVSRPHAETSTHSPPLKLLHFNAWSFRNRDPASLAQYLETADFDLVFVQESHQTLIDHMLERHAEYEMFRAGDSYRHGATVAFLNRARVPGVDVISMQRLTKGRICELRLSRNGSEIAILLPHLTIPGPGGNNTEREAECELVCNWVNAQTVPTIVIGDLNATPWCKEFRSLLAGTELINSQQGFGVQCTWPRRPPFALSWMFSIAIDHCLHSADFVTVDRRIGPWLGSDHLPLEVELKLRSEA